VLHPIWRIETHVSNLAVAFPERDLASRVTLRLPGKPAAVDCEAQPQRAHRVQQNQTRCDEHDAARPSRGNLAGPRHLIGGQFQPRYEANRSDIGKIKPAAAHDCRGPHLEPDHTSATHCGHRSLRTVLLVERQRSLDDVRNMGRLRLMLKALARSWKAMVSPVKIGQSQPSGIVQNQPGKCRLRRIQK
jgi:hypothetical protein